MVLPFTTRFRTARVAVKRAGEDWDQIGDQALFYWDSVVSIPRAIKHYKKETLRLIAEISMGTGALAMIGGFSPSSWSSLAAPSWSSGS